MCNCQDGDEAEVRRFLYHWIPFTFTLLAEALFVLYVGLNPEGNLSWFLVFPAEGSGPELIASFKGTDIFM